MAKIILIDKSKIKFDLNFLKKIIEVANLPTSQILLVFNNCPLFNHNLGIAVPRNLYFSIRDRGFFFEYKDRDWDCAIAFSEKACNKFEHYPAYFVYLMGHEFGHAHICLKDEALHIHYCLIQEFIQDASNDIIRECYKLPHEILFDRFGIYIAEQIYSREKLNIEIEEMLKDPECKDHDRLNQMLKMKSTNDLSHLRNDLISFSIPYKIYEGCRCLTI